MGNRYSFVANGPISRSDAMGLKDDSCKTKLRQLVRKVRELDKRRARLRRSHSRLKKDAKSLQKLYDELEFEADKFGPWNVVGLDDNWYEQDYFGANDPSIGNTIDKAIVGVGLAVRVGVGVVIGVAATAKTAIQSHVVGGYHNEARAAIRQAQRGYDRAKRMQRKLWKQLKAERKALVEAYGAQRQECNLQRMKRRMERGEFGHIFDTSRNKVTRKKKIKQAKRRNPGAADPLMVERLRGDIERAAAKKRGGRR